MPLEGCWHSLCLSAGNVQTSAHSPLKARCAPAVFPSPPAGDPCLACLLRAGHGCSVRGTEVRKVWLLPRGAKAVVGGTGERCRRRPLRAPRAHTLGAAGAVSGGAPRGAALLG